MITYRALDNNGDYTFGSGLANMLIDNPEAIAQAVQTRLKLWQGEFFLDITEGTPYLNGMVGKYTRDTIDQLIKNRIYETNGVLSIDLYSGLYDGNMRSYAVNVTIMTIYGQIQISGAF